mmetsp:Transcript_1300/g.1055  ORF Transcript_1300/g.1055 Transcript_1300/m.1055 type:complete len:444 (-) Transcript_1300:3-1334(-)
MPAPTPAPVNNATNSNCLRAEYENIMHKSNGDELHVKQILTSSNCQYILIRDPSTKLTFYSTLSPENPIIHSWDINEQQSIWEIHPLFSSSDTIKISNDGCLIFTDNSDATPIPYCVSDTTSSQSFGNKDIDLLNPSLGNNNDKFPFDLSSSSSTYIPYEDDNNMSLFSGNILEDIKHVEIWVPILLCIMGILCALIFLIVYFLFRKKGDYSYDPDLREKEATDSIESDTDDDMHINDHHQWNAHNLHVNPEMISEDEEQGYYDHNRNTPGGSHGHRRHGGNRLTYDDYNADTEQEQDSGSDIDLSDCRPISDDCFVSQRVLSIATPNILRMQTSEDYDPQIQSPQLHQQRDMTHSINTGLMVPNKMLKVRSGGSSGSSSSELEMSSDYIQKRISNSGGSSLVTRRMGSKLAVIQDEIECVRDVSVNVEDGDEESSDNPQHMI